MLRRLRARQRRLVGVVVVVVGWRPGLWLVNWLLLALVLLLLRVVGPEQVVSM